MANPLKKTMMFLGLADEEYEDDYVQQPEREEHIRPAPAAPAPRHGSATVTQLRRPPVAPVAPMPEMTEILTVHPRTYDEAPAIADAFREGVPVIINLSQMPDPKARRVVDFVSGLAAGLSGRFERVAEKVFLLSPAYISVSGAMDGEETPDNDR